MYFKKDKPGISLVNLFISVLKKKYMVKIYTPRDDYMEIVLNPDLANSQMFLCIKSVKHFNLALFFYINALNNYYLNIRKKPITKSLDQIFNDTLLGISMDEMLDYTAYIEQLTENLNKKINKNDKKIHIKSDN